MDNTQPSGMSGPDEPPPFAIPEGQYAVASYRKRRTAEDHALVILAMKLPYWLYQDGDRYLLCVEEEQAEAVASQLERYHRESRFWPPRPAATPEEAPAGRYTLVLYAVALVGLFIVQRQWLPFQRLGMMDTLGLLQNGQWWRVFTAQTLHADEAHLAGNLVSGICFAILVNRSFGAGLGWFMIILSGALGNLLTALTYYPDQHYSLGASTAVFGALGVLVGQAALYGLNPGGITTWKHRLIPIFGGITVLGLTGASGDNTDVLGHVFGFVAGTVIGVAVSWWTRCRIPPHRLQLPLGTAAILLPTLAWLTALWNR